MEKSPTMHIFPSVKNTDLSEEHVLQGAEDPNDVVLLFKASSLERAKAFMNNPAVGEAIQKSGVVGKPDVAFLNS